MWCLSETWCVKTVAQWRHAQWSQGIHSHVCTFNADKGGPKLLRLAVVFKQTPACVRTHTHTVHCAHGTPLWVEAVHDQANESHVLPCNEKAERQRSLDQGRVREKHGSGIDQDRCRVVEYHDARHSLLCACVGGKQSAHALSHVFMGMQVCVTAMRGGVLVLAHTRDYLFQTTHAFLSHNRRAGSRKSAQVISRRPECTYTLNLIAISMMYIVGHQMKQSEYSARSSVLRSSTDLNGPNSIQQ